MEWHLAQLGTASPPLLLRQTTKLFILSASRCAWARQLPHIAVTQVIIAPSNPDETLVSVSWAFHQRLPWREITVRVSSLQRIALRGWT
jgi:hypothetical protein